MGTAFLYGNGGSGGGGLNFSVKEYAPETVLPSTGKENTIIVITDVKIASWIFSVTEPIAPAEGIVWIPFCGIRDSVNPRSAGNGDQIADFYYFYNGEV